MRLTDIMSAAGLTTWVEVALVIFLTVFVAIAVYVFAVRKRGRWERARYMPLEDDVPQEPRGESRTEDGTDDDRSSRESGRQGRDE